MDKRIEQIRKEEKDYHASFYEEHELFEEGTWLSEPIESVMEAFKKFDNRRNLRVLDLGSGVGRHSIPIAKEIKHFNGKVVCVDFLDTAIDKLVEYSREHDVQNVIEPVQADIGEYEIKENHFDLIIAVSSLEHASSPNVFKRILKRMKGGTKPGGINCMIIHGQARDTEEEVTMEIDYPSEEIIRQLDKNFDGWETIDRFVEPFEFKTVRNDKPLWLKANTITYTTKKPKS